MNTDAGWKLNSRKPSAAPAVIAARMPAVLRPRSNAMIENATAEIAHTPAASPSTPSEKFTTFISATSPSAVTGAPRSPISTRCTNGNVNASTVTPDVTSTTAAATCPASLISQCRSKTSSSAPTIVISAAPARMPSVRWLSGRKSRPATSAPPKIASPPSSGVASRARPRSFTSSTAPIRRAKRAATGVSTAATAKATSAARTALVSMIGRQGSQGALTRRRPKPLTFRETGLSSGGTGEDTPRRRPPRRRRCHHPSLTPSSRSPTTTHCPTQRTLPRVVTAALAAVLLTIGTPLGFLVVKDQPVAALNSKAWLDEE